MDVIFYKWITAKIQAELTEGISLKNAYIDLAFLPEARLRLGQFQVPFSLEELTSSRFIDFVERSIVNELAPSYDRGIMLHGDLLQGGISYYLGGFNGTGEDTSDNNGDKDLAFRLAFVPFRSSESFWLKGLHLAGDVTWGNEDSINSPQGQTGARTPHRFTFFAAQPTRGDRLRYGGDMAWLIDPASLKFEYHVQQNARNQLGPGGSNLDDVVATGWYVSGTYIITGEDKPFNGPVVPKRPFSPFLDHMGPGAWEVGVRFASLDFDSDSPACLQIQLSSARSLAGGVAHEIFLELGQDLRERPAVAPHQRVRRGLLDLYAPADGALEYHLTPRARQVEQCELHCHDRGGCVAWAEVAVELAHDRLEDVGRPAHAVGLSHGLEWPRTVEPFSYPIAQHAGGLSDEGVVGIGGIPHFVHAVDERLPRERSRHANVGHPQRLRPARGSRRGRGQLNDVRRRLGDRLADRAGREDDAGADRKREAEPSHFDSFGSTTFSGGPPNSAPAG